MFRLCALWFANSHNQTVNELVKVSEPAQNKTAKKCADVAERGSSDGEPQVPASHVPVGCPNEYQAGSLKLPNHLTRREVAKL